MKNRIIVSVVSALFVVGLLSSCDLFDKADDVSFSTEIEKSFIVNDANDSYAQTIVLDATADPEVEKYKEKISGITVNKVTYKVANYVGPDGAEFSGDVLFGPSGSLGTVSINDLNLSSASDSGAEIELNLSQETVDAVANQLKTDNTVSVTMSGTFSDGPVDLVIEIKIDAKVTADAL